jgi:hypothetical protein
MAESANDIMARGGANSDSLRLQADLAAVDAWAGPKDMNAAVVADDDSVDDEDEDAEEDDDTAVQDEVQTAAKWPKGQPLESLQTHQYRNNSPTKCKRQRTSGKSDTWQVVKRLTDLRSPGGTGLMYALYAVVWCGAIITRRQRTGCPRMPTIML